MSDITPLDVAMPIAGGVVGAVYNEASQRSAERRSVRYSKELADYNYRLQRQAERDAPMNQKLGLERAGISTALATQGKFSAPVGNSVTPPQTQGQKIDPMFVADLTTKQLQNALLKEEVRGKDIENTRMEDEDATYDKNLRAWIDGQLTRTDISEDYRSMLESMRGNVHPYSKGSFDGIDKFIELTPKMQEQILRKVTAEYQNKIVETKQALQQYEWVARMDTATFDKLVADTAQIQMNTSLLAAKVGLSRMEGNKLMAETQKLIEETKAISNGNVVELWTNGEWKKLMAFYGDKAIGTAMDVASVGGKMRVGQKALESFKHTLRQGEKASKKFSAPSVKHVETWTDKRGHLHSKTSRK